MTLFKINTTAFEDEEFMLVTNLTEQDIMEVINPIVMAERDGYEEYNNDMLVEALITRYPKAIIHMYTDSSINLITI